MGVKQQDYWNRVLKRAEAEALSFLPLAHTRREAVSAGITWAAGVAALYLFLGPEGEQASWEEVVRWTAGGLAMLVLYVVLVFWFFFRSPALLDAEVRAERDVLADQLGSNELEVAIAEMKSRTLVVKDEQITLAEALRRLGSMLLTEPDRSALEMIGTPALTGIEPSVFWKMKERDAMKEQVFRDVVKPLMLLNVIDVKRHTDIVPDNLATSMTLGGGPSVQRIAVTESRLVYFLTGIGRQAYRRVERDHLASVKTG